jgi:hypothetical protein
VPAREQTVAETQHDLIVVPRILVFHQGKIL